MIKVNLLPQRKAKRVASSAPSANAMYAGIGALVAAGAAVFVVLDMPKRSEIGKLKEASAKLQLEINEKNKALKGYAELKKAEEESKKRAESINRLISNKVVPAHVMHELGRVLTREGPTMSEAMTRLAGTGPDGDPNKRFQGDWDPAHVWMTSFVDSAGGFKLDGGAQSESDVTQLSKRLAASVFFLDVTPAGGERVFDRTSGMTYYRFTITGRIVY